MRSGQLGAYDGAPIDADDEVEPGLDGELQVGVAQHLEAKQALLLLLLAGVVAVKAGYEAVERVEHGRGR